MHADGIDVLVDVGARGNLAGFVEDTLRGRPAFAIAANLPRRSGLLQLNHVVASLFARGADLDARHLYARRRPERIDFEASPSPPPSVSSIAVGFPAMSLSPALVERLLRHTDERVEESSGFEPWVDGPHERSTSNGFHPHVSVDSHPVALETQRSTLAESSRFSVAEVPSAADLDATLLDFQATMAEFLRTQQAVMDAYLAPGLAVGEEFEFHLPAPTLIPTAVEGGPWAGTLTALVDGVEAVSTVILDAEGDPVAEHHTLGGRRISAVHPEWRGLPVLPFAVMAEILAQAATRLRPGLAVVALRDVRAHRWIRYEAGPVALEIRARVEPDDASLIRVAIHNRGPVGAMNPLEPPVFEGIVAFDEATPIGPVAPPFAIDQRRDCRFTPESIYGDQWLFHGPVLQAVVGIGPIGPSGIEGTLRVRPFAPLLRDGEDASALRTDPIILDNFTHLLGGWGLDELADDGDVIFPLRMGELAIFGASPSVGEDVACRIAIREVERHRVLVDADLVRSDGSTWMKIRGWEDWRFHWPGRYRDGFRQPDRTFLGEPLDLPAELKGRVSAVWLEPPSDMGRPVWRDVLEHVQLGVDERSAYLALPGPDSRRTHRLWGRIAAKEAARRLWLDRGGETVYPADLMVDRDALGRPHLRSRLGHNSLPSISIAHVDGVAVALASLDAMGWVGIDVEPIVSRSATFESTAFLPGEIALLGDRSGDDRAEWVARLWCAKEAVAKATGQGFVDGPSGVEVVTVDESGTLGVRLRGSLARACQALAWRVVEVTSARRGDHVWAWTLGEGMRP
jgi:phosphopantetheinyl transferase (holo-ACP synthase)